MRTSFLSFSPPWITDGDIEQVVAALRSGWVTTGPRVIAFQEQFAQAVSAPAALAVSSCTAALHLALCALDVKPGEGVITTPMTFCSTVHTIEQVGATPIFVDVEQDTLNLSPEGVEQVLEDHRRARVTSPRPAAIVVVHYGGHPADMAAFYDLGRSYGVPVIEDAAHAVGAFVDGRPVGAGPASGDLPWLAAFSFYATKNLTTGEGGMLTGPADLVDRARPLSLHGMSQDAWGRYGEGGSWGYDVEAPGFKYNMTDLQAALGISQLSRLAEITDRRRRIAERYTNGLENLKVHLPTERPGYRHAWHLYTLRLPLERMNIDRREFIAAMTARKIGTSVHFIPVHTLTYYRDRYEYKPYDFPVTYAAFERLVSLPIYPGMVDQDVDDVVEAVGDLVAAG